MSNNKSSQHWRPSDLTPKNSSLMMSPFIPVDLTSHGINPATVSAHADLETHIYIGHTCREPPHRCDGDCRFTLSYFYDLLISRCSGRNSSSGFCFSGPGVVILSGGGNDPAQNLSFCCQCAGKVPGRGSWQRSRACRCRIYEMVACLQFTWESL